MNLSKKIIVASVLFGAVATLPVFLLAQTETDVTGDTGATVNITLPKTNLENLRAENAAKIEAQREEQKAKMEAATQTRKEEFEKKMTDKKALEEKMKAERKEMEEKKKAERKEMEEKIKAEREQTIAEMKERKEAIEKEMKDKKEAMHKIARTMIVRAFEKRSENLTQIASRIKTRMEKMKAEGIDTTVAAELVVKAETSIALSKTNADLAKAAAEGGDTIDNIKKYLSTAKESLKQAQAYLDQAIKDLKSKFIPKVRVEGEAKVEADSTTTSNTSSTVVE